MTRRRRNNTPFRAWGLLLTAAVVLLIARDEWGYATFVAILLVLYLLTVRLARCRVETKRHTPCLWRVRGLLGTCDYHVGYKRSLPTLVWGQRGLGLVPMFMWRRSDFSDRHRPVERQPESSARGADQVANRAKRPAYDWAMFGISAVGLLITAAAFVKSFFPGN